MATPAAATAPAKPAFTDAQLIEEFGWFIGKRVGLTELEFSAAELETLLKGFRGAAEGKDSPYELEKIGPLMDDFMQKKQAAYVAKLKTKNLPTLDAGLSGLFQTLALKGLLDSTLVFVTGEFGRTPKLNANGGRDHWANCAA